MTTLTQYEAALAKLAMVLRHPPTDWHRNIWDSIGFTPPDTQKHRIAICEKYRATRCFKSDGISFDETWSPLFIQCLTEYMMAQIISIKATEDNLNKDNPGIDVDL
jgi:hypothetical protein